LSHLEVKIGIIFLIGKTFVNGLAIEYDDDSYDLAIMGPVIQRKDFQRIMNQINDTLFTYFACPFCRCFGYCCCPCTLGLSFFFPYVCIRDAEKEVRNLIFRLNEELLNKRGIEIELKISCMTSWVSIDLLPLITISIAGVSHN
jgi:hypothetical protein